MTRDGATGKSGYGTDSWDEARDISVDDLGNIYVVGGIVEHTQRDTFYRFVLLKYSQSGDLVWERFPLEDYANPIFLSTPMSVP